MHPRHHRVLPRRGRREAARARRPRRAGRDARVVLPAGACPWVRPAHRRDGSGRCSCLRVLRVLQGARRCLRAAHLPVGLAQGAPHGQLPRRRPHPRPRHVPQAADPRRRPPVRRHRAAARRQRLRRGLPRRTGRPGRRRTGPHPPRRARCHRRQRGVPDQPLLPDARGYGIRIALAEVKGISDAEVDADRRRAALPLAHRLLAPRRGLSAGGRAARARRRLRRPARHRPHPGASGRPPVGG